ncbi:hypothetical protein TgHK011_000485 [Trichoderma gracile]|nr:hypothetical protein TgHK011_000485 [Trichoderma gracile]
MWKFWEEKEKRGPGWEKMLAVDRLVALVRQIPLSCKRRCKVEIGDSDKDGDDAPVKYQVRVADAGGEQAMRRLGDDRGDRQWEWRGLEVGGRPWNLDLAAVILIDGQRWWL